MRADWTCNPPIVLKQKFKKGSFYCPFFFVYNKISLDEQLDELWMNN